MSFLSPLKVKNLPQRSESKQENSHFSKKEKVLGQFFTPREVVDFVLDFISVTNNKKDKAIDPACGDGVFLKGLIAREFKEVVGIDIDCEVVKSIAEELKTNADVLNEDGLLNKSEGNFDVVVGNPPFSSKYGRVKNCRILQGYKLGRSKRSQAVEILFLEKFIRLASPEGVIGIVLPFGIFSNLPLRYIREFLLKETSLIGVVSLPRGIFNSSQNTTSKTCILFAKKGKGPERVFMGVAESLKELPVILNSYRKGTDSTKPIAFWVNPHVDALYPEFYITDLPFGEANQSVKRLKDLVSEMFGGKTEYAQNRAFSREGIPFISAKTITQLGVDLSRDGRYVGHFSKMYKHKAHVRVGDLLFVRVGVGCIGRAAVITHPSECGVADDYIYIIRTNEEELAYYLAFYLQSKYGVSQINRMKRGVGTVTIPQTLLKNFLIPLPSASLKDKIKKFYLEMVREKESNRYNAEMIRREAVKCIEEEVEGIVR